MLVLKEKDYLEVSVNSLIADYDRLTLTNLYQPIIGYKAVSLFFTLLSEYDNQKINPIINHEMIFARTQMNAGEFVDARRALEAIGLLKTYVSDLKGAKLYQYELYAPKTPKLFFDNTLFYGMLAEKIGDTEASKLKNLFNIKQHQDGVEITAQFNDVFNPNYDNPAYKKVLNELNKTMGRQSAKINSGFSYELFFKTLSEISQINKDALSKTDMKEIERLATLYGIREEVIAQIVSENYIPSNDKDNKLDFDGITKKLIELSNYSHLARKTKQLDGRTSGETDLAMKINLMEAAKPSQYLFVKNGTTPSNSDLSIVNDLSIIYRLPNSVINAIVDYVLTTNNNILNRSLTEKIAGSVAREGCKTAIDTMNYLKKTSRRKKAKETSKDDILGGTNEPIKKEKKKVPSMNEFIELLEEDDENGKN